jgi:probable phosphoglycerate mutase
VTVPEPTRLVAVRHGETAWNVELRMQGQLDVPLNDTGRWQAERLAEALRDERFDAIHASDLARALETARIVARSQGIEVTADSGLRERCFGEFQGLTFDEVSRRWPEGARRWKHREPDYAPEGAESLRAFAARCVAAVERIAARHAGGSILVVAHGGVLDSLYRAATHVPLQPTRSWALGNASINRLLWTPQGFALVGWNDTAHLEAAPLDEADEGEGRRTVPDRMGYAA